MNRYIITIIAVLSLAFMACGGTSTYKISGTVYLNGVGYEGVTVTLSGFPDVTTVTDSSGYYVFSDIQKGEGYIVTPSLSANGYTQTFEPFAYSVDINKSSSTGNDFDINVFEISGQVTMNGSGYPNVDVSLAGDASGAAITDGSGLYTFWVMNGDYMVTASLTGQTMQPASYSPTIDGSGSINNDFALDIYEIAGQVTLQGLGYSGGAAVSLTGDAALDITTDAGGYYSFMVLNGTYNVTPSVTGQTLTPTNISSIAISGASSSNNDFALDTHTVSGTVTWNGSGYGFAQISLSGTAASGETYTDVLTWTENDGSYSYTVLNGTYTVTPTITGQSLTPTTIAGIGISGSDSTGNDFTLDTYSISGQVMFDGDPYEGASIKITGDEFSEDTTDASGNYQFSGLLNGSYNVAPGYTWQPSGPTDRDIVINNQSSFNQDFTLNAHAITGRVTLNGLGYPGVTVTMSGDDSGSTITGPSGDYTFIVINGDYTVTPSLAGQTLTPTSTGPFTIYENDATGVDFALDTTALSGQVTLNGSGFEGVTVGLAGTTMNGSTTTDGSGNYSFNVLNDTFTVTPSLSGQTLTPVDESGITITGTASPGHDFALDTYPLTGQVTLTGSPYEGATINLTGTLTDSTTTDSGGGYTLDVLNGTYTVTPVVAGQTLTPTNISGIVISSAADTGNNFAINTYTISGQVTLNGAAYEGAAIALSGDASMAATTDASGNYSFTDLPNGNYTVTPTVAGQTLDPATLTPTILDADSTGNNFAINTYTISGQVTLNGSPFAAAQVALTGDATDNTVTDGSGNYSFSGLVNGDYLVTPAVTGQTLSPSFIGRTITDGDSTGNDFAINTYTISGQVTLNSLGYPGATVNLSAPALTTTVIGTTTDGSGNYSFTGLVNADYTVTPVVAGQTLTPLDIDLTIANADDPDNDFALDTYAISGQVTLLSSGYEGATITLSGDANDSTTSDGSGNYTFAGLLNGDYTVTPTVGGQTLTPANYILNIDGADLPGKDFAVSTNTISGQVTLNGAPYEGATITLSGDADDSTTTDVSGNYSFPELLNGNYTVTPTVAGQTLDPSDHDVNISDTSSTGNDFTINTYTISGQVTLGVSGYEGASVDLTGAAGASTSTDGSGNYSFTGLLSGDYTVTPSLAGQTLTPTERNITIGLADSTGNDFAIDSYSISGQVTLNGAPYEGAAVVLSGDAGDSTTTDASGNYSFAGLFNGTYTVTPTVSGQTLTPTSISPIVVSGADSTGNDFALDTYTLSGQVTVGGSGYPGVTVNLTGDATDADSTDGSGNYSFTGLLRGAYIVTPSLSGQTFNPANYTPGITGSDITGLDFTLNAWSISGNVSNGDGPMEWINVTLSGDATSSTRTDSSGDYTFTNVLPGSYTVTPVAAPQTFSPTSASFPSLSGNETGVDFTVPSMIWTANVDATATTQNGYSWQTAFRHPQNAADVAALAGTAVGDQVWVANGPYYAYGDTTDFTVPVLMLTEGFDYYGGFAGTETTLSERDLMANSTTLDGLDTAQEIVVAANNTMLNGFAVEHGLVPAYFYTYAAPVNAAEVSNFSVINCVVANNVVSTANGINSSGMNFGSGLVLNTIFRNNRGWDGPLFVRGVSGSPDEEVNIINVASFYNNAYYGGGMLLGGEGPIRVVNTTIANNSTSDSFEAVGIGKGIWMHMGGLYLPDGDATVTNSIVYGDIAGHGNTVGENLPVVTYSLMESFGATYEVTFADSTNQFATTLGNTPNFVSWAGSPVYMGNHPFQIASNSPCIDAGDDTAIPTAILTEYFGAEVDMLGNPRSVDWPPNMNGTGVDMGAYEFIEPWEPGMP